MNLDDTQKRTVTDWIAQGQTISDIQKRLASELDLHMTYMEVRLLVDDLKLTPKDTERAKPVELAGKSEAAGPEMSDPAAPGGGGLLRDEPAAGEGNVTLKVDTLARAGSLVSGSVTFRDGKSALWYLDQQGRIGLAPAQPGYKPSAADMQAFQMELQNELAKMGF